MSTKKIANFPSLYDTSLGSEDIWTTMLSRYGRADPKTNADEEAWPSTGILTVPKYQPLEFYCPPGTAVWSEGDAVCELGIRLKEIELLTLMGEADDIVSATSEALKEVKRRNNQLANSL